MDYIILVLCFAAIYIFVKNFAQMNTLNTKNIKVIQPISIYKAPDIDVFKYYVSETKKTPEEAWKDIIDIGSEFQTFEEFINEKKVHFHLKGILIMLVMEVAAAKRELVKAKPIQYRED